MWNSASVSCDGVKTGEDSAKNGRIIEIAANFFDHEKYSILWKEEVLFWENL